MVQPKAAVSRGRRVALLPSDSTSKVDGIYVCGSKPLDFGEFTLTKGVEVPGAAAWTRIDAWTGARRIRKIEHDEKYISFLEFTGKTYESYLEDQQQDAGRLASE